MYIYTLTPTNTHTHTQNCTQTRMNMYFYSNRYTFLHTCGRSTYKHICTCMNLYTCKHGPTYQQKACQKGALVACPVCVCVSVYVCVCMCV